MSIKILLATVLALLMCPLPRFCQASVPTQHKLYMFPGFVNPEPKFVAWLNKPWSGDDSAYAKNRAQVDQAEGHGRLQELVDAYHGEYKADPTNLDIQFKYLYAVWLNRWENDIKYSTDEMMEMQAFTEMLRTQQMPNTYNFTRAAALCWNCWSTDKSLLPYAERLAQRDSTDIVAGYFYAGLLAESNKSALQSLAVQRANLLVAEHPNLKDYGVVGVSPQFVAEIVTTQCVADGYSTQGYVGQVSQLCPNIADYLPAGLWNWTPN